MNMPDYPHNIIINPRRFGRATDKRRQAQEFANTSGKVVGIIGIDGTIEEIHPNYTTILGRVTPKL